MKTKERVNILAYGSLSTATKLIEAGGVVKGVQAMENNEAAGALVYLVSVAAVLGNFFVDYRVAKSHIVAESQEPVDTK